VCYAFAALPAGWYQLGSTAFKLFPEHRSWHKAVAACIEKGAVIAQIKNEEENQFVTLLHHSRKPGNNRYRSHGAFPCGFRFRCVSYVLRRISEGFCFFISITGKQLPLSLRPLAHWRFDGTDKNLT
jgi:hypothetical protein